MKLHNPQRLGRVTLGRVALGRVTLGLVLALAAMLGGCDRELGPTRLPVELAGRTFKLELALDADQRYQGLSDRESIPPDGGMLFVFPQPTQAHFVMRRCLVPIDIIFLDPAGRIIAMHQMAVEPYDTPEHQLKRYPSRYPALFAIELAGGTLDGLGLREGDTIDLPADRLRQHAK